MKDLSSWVRAIVYLSALLPASALATPRVLNGHWFSPHRLVKWPFAVTDTAVQIGAGALELQDASGRSSYAWISPKVSHQLTHRRWAFSVGFAPEMRTPTAAAGFRSKGVQGGTQLSGTLMVEAFRTRRWVLSPFVTADFGHRLGLAQPDLGNQLREVGENLLKETAQSRSVKAEEAEARLKQVLSQAAPSEETQMSYSGGLGFAIGLLPELGLMADLTRNLAQEWSASMALTVREIGLGRHATSGIAYRRIAHLSGYTEQIGLNLQHLVEKSVGFAIDTVWEERRDSSGTALWGSYGTWITSRFYY